MAESGAVERSAAQESSSRATKTITTTSRKLRVGIACCGARSDDCRGAVCPRSFTRTLLPGLQYDAAGGELVVGAGGEPVEGEGKGEGEGEGEMEDVDCPKDGGQS